MKKGLLFVCMCVLGFTLAAQKSVALSSPELEYRSAMELFHKEKYGSARELFKQVYDYPTHNFPDLKANAYFYLGVCAAKLYHEDAIFLLKDFIRHYPVHAFVPEARYFLGKFYFYKRQYKKSLEQYESIDERHIAPNDLAEYYFKKGYCYFELKKEKEAKAFFEKASRSNGDYRLRARYYLAHLAYQDGQYQAALESFEALSKEPEYADAVPAYIAQIYFLQKRYEDLLAYLPNKMDKIRDKNQEDIERILALSYYNLGFYDKSLLHFSNYIPVSKKPVAREDYFAAGYACYQTNNYKQAVEYLSKTTKEQDAMTQNSLYLVGDCYIHLRQMNLASQSFLEASKLDFKKDIKEDALYNYAKLQYAIARTPFNAAIKALENYIDTYPNSTHHEEAQSLLSSIYLSTKNYPAAIKSLEQIKSKTPNQLRAYQRCTHFRALELINSNKFNEAVALLDKSLTYPLDKSLRVASLYWKAEAEYRSGHFKEAYYHFQTYQRHENAKNNEHYIESFYGLGYSAMQIKRYADAEKSFDFYVKKADSERDLSQFADATARLADACFMQKEIKQALKYYEQTEALHQSNAAYALYQQAICYSYLHNDAKKIEMLDKLVLYYPKSKYNDDAEYDLANTYQANNNYSMAIMAYQNFVNKYPKSIHIRQAYNKMALCYLNTQEEDMAIKTFKYVFEKYPGSREAKDALANLENIYTEQSNTVSFFEYVRNQNFNISETKQDSISFKAGESKYLRGDCEAAIRAFDSYVSQFPQGMFVGKAYFYKAECAYGLKNFNKALTDYEYILQHFSSEYNETAARRAATILYNKKEYQRAWTYFKQLLDMSTNEQTTRYAQNAIMHCAFELKQYRETLNAAKVLLQDKNLDSELSCEAKLIAGKSALATGDYATAVSYFQPLAATPDRDHAAEAAYLSCLAEFQQKNYDECEKQITNMLSTRYSSDAEYWFASVFILYGDLYAARENYFQARYTYQSIVDNYEGEDLKQIARNKIMEINKLENKDSYNPQPDEEEMPSFDDEE
ncbi:MAG: tetratricopeptide repeat protein [Bacteroidales bacterium]|nr:tetratricopeptide repeat protein [Bacteroidales bacterium]